MPMSGSDRSEGNPRFQQRWPRQRLLRRKPSVACPIQASLGDLEWGFSSRLSHTVGLTLITLPRRHPERGRAEQRGSESKDLLLRPAVIPITARRNKPPHTQEHVRPRAYVLRSNSLRKEIAMSMRLKVSPADASKLVQSIPHKTCSDGIANNWRLNPDGTVRAQSVFWLFCWGKTGMNSENARSSAVRVFEALFPVSFSQFDRVVKHEYARQARYATQNIEHEMDEILKLIK
jgi:hypothetical protein